MLFFQAQQLLLQYISSAPASLQWRNLPTDFAEDPYFVSVAAASHCASRPHAVVSPGRAGRAASASGRDGGKAPRVTGQRPHPRRQP